MPNTFPESATITTRRFVACFIVWIGTYPAMALKIHKMRHVWTFKAWVIPPVTMGFFIYCMVVGSRGATRVTTTSEPLSASQLGWAFMYSVQAIIGNFSPLITSNPDIARYAAKPSATVWPQILTIAFWKTVVCLIGIFGTNAIAYRYGTVYWNLWDMCDMILTENWNAGARCAIFLFAILMSFSEQAKNLSANLISFGADSASLLPKYLNINRGMILGLTVGFVIQPWRILATATAYLTFLSGYSLFLGAIPSIAVMDYILRKGNVNVLSLYTPKKGTFHPTNFLNKALTDADYWYMAGVNWKAYAAYVMAIWPVCPGFAWQFDRSHNIAEGWIHLYQMGWLFAVAMGAFTYGVLSFLFKDPAMYEARKHPWESFAISQKDLLDNEPGETTVIEASSTREEDLETANSQSEKGRADESKGDHKISI
jgi:nucleobase:cation symporter-1, NCS1 family